MIHCIVVDDEPIAREILEGHISRHASLQLAGSCPTALKAFDLLHTKPVQLMFLDIKMPGINGIDFLKSLKNPPKVVFTTAFSEYALTAFELEVVDYLLKPITYERFEKSIQKIRQLGGVNDPVERQYTYFRVSGKLVKILHKDLLFVRAVKDYILLQTPTGSHLSHMSMKGVAELLSDSRFVRIHRSYIINLNYIEEINKTGVRVGSELLPIGNSYREELLGVVLKRK